jgi:hypothetical protein
MTTTIRPASPLVTCLMSALAMTIYSTAINLTNKTALYNFLSTFSGTHFVMPRTYTAELGFHF